MCQANFVRGYRGFRSNVASMYGECCGRWSICISPGMGDGGDPQVPWPLVIPVYKFRVGWGCGGDRDAITPRYHLNVPGLGFVVMSSAKSGTPFPW